MILTGSSAAPAIAGRRSRHSAGHTTKRALPATAAAAPTTAPPPEIALIASDVDGTLLDPQQNLSPRVAAAVRAAADAGVPLIVATGKARGPWAEAVLPRLAPSSRSPPMPGVFLQGLLVADAQGRTLWSRSLEEEVLLDAIALARDLGMTLTAYTGERIVAQSLDEHTERLLFYKEPTPEAVGPLDLLLAKKQLPPVQKVIFMASAERAAAAREEIEARLGERTGRGSCTTALPGMVELLPPGASKGAGLKWLLDNALPPEVERRWREVQQESGGGNGGNGDGDGGSNDSPPLLRGLMAMGDGENDREMLAMAEWGVAMGNAGQGLKQAAQAVVASNADDGVAEAIERFVLAPRGLALTGAGVAAGRSS
jgi:hydroxymethylpyrimidine pyrophosphatase-like HAD family hydrolase